MLQPSVALLTRLVRCHTIARDSLTFINYLFIFVLKICFHFGIKSLIFSVYFCNAFLPLCMCIVLLVLCVGRSFLVVFVDISQVMLSLTVSVNVLLEIFLSVRRHGLLIDCKAVRLMKWCTWGVLVSFV